MKNDTKNSIGFLNPSERINFLSDLIIDNDPNGIIIIIFYIYLHIINIFITNIFFIFSYNKECKGIK